ncbi:Deoxyhypusine hydroxylase-B [Nymphaea thermarum]|nr:Deoxyhypusine hydroxylase-B [Nymphaea thermarum]
MGDHDSVALLEEFTRDPEPIVSQSCEVALSMLDFERRGKPFERSGLKIRKWHAPANLNLRVPKVPEFKSFKSSNAPKVSWLQLGVNTSGVEPEFTQLELGSANETSSSRIT